MHMWALEKLFYAFKILFRMNESNYRIKYNIVIKEQILHTDYKISKFKQ